MKNTKTKSLLVGNALLYPVSQWLPTGTGMPPRIFELLIAVLIILMGFGSTSFLRTALKKDGEE